MKNRSNVIGLNGFVWWVGEIEDRVDPLAMGRCRVRIFGWHTDNKALLPTDHLPWAQAVIPLNNSKSWSSPTVGDWVVGFFMDGDSAQFPVMMGVLPGIKQDENT
jgi:phage baseplate assembly protein gpV